MKIITGNDLATGAVVWWDGTGWSHHVDAAADVSTEDQAAIIAAAIAARAVAEAQVIDATQTPEGIRPAHIKDRVRALGGPTVRLDLSLKPADPAAANWVL